MFDNILENAIAQIEAKRRQQIDSVRQEVVTSKIVPFNAEIDASLRQAIAEMQQEHSDNIAKMQKVFESNKLALGEAADAKKKAFAEKAIEEAVAQINCEADLMISYLRQKLSKED